MYEAEAMHEFRIQAQQDVYQKEAQEVFYFILENKKEENTIFENILIYSYVFF